MPHDYIAPVGVEGIYVIKTGKWRTQHPVLAEEKCVKCGKCFMFCPVGAIKRRDDRYHIDLEYCKGCGVCSHECPAKAIQMIGEEGK